MKSEKLHSHRRSDIKTLTTLKNSFEWMNFNFQNFIKSKKLKNSTKSMLYFARQRKLKTTPTSGVWSVLSILSPDKEEDLLVEVYLL